MKYLWDPLLEVVHLQDEIGEVLFVLDLWVLEQGVVQSSDEDQDLAPVDVRGVSHLLHAGLSLLILKLR